ncbi:MAG: transposase [Mycobacterium sp.]|nr:transposase [Mycobacterium sp.]
MIKIREVLRAWLAGRGLRLVATQAGVDRKTARRYVAAAVAGGLDRDGGVEQLGDELIGAVVAAVRPDRPQGFGSAWEVLRANQDRINAWVDDGLTVVKIGDLLARQGVIVPQRTLYRYCVAHTSYAGRRPAGTVPVVDGEPGVECQIDFARMGSGRSESGLLAFCATTESLLKRGFKVYALRKGARFQVRQRWAAWRKSLSSAGEDHQG